MKKDFNQFTKSDLPLDSAINSSFSPTQAKTTKSKIKVIGEKKAGARSATRPKTTTATTTKTTAAKTTTAKTTTAKTTKSISEKTAIAAKTTKPTAKTTSSATKKNDVIPEEKAKKTKIKLTSSVNIEDLEKANEESIKKYSFRSRRNRVIIIILSLLLVISIVGVITFVAVNKLKNNCYLYMHGNAEAVYLIEGEEMDEFRTPSTIKGDRIYQFKLELNIKSSGQYACRFKVDCFKNGQKLENTLIYELNSELFRMGNDGYYVSVMPLQGNSKILVCHGIILDKEYESSISVNNFKMEFHTYLEKV